MGLRRYWQRIITNKDPGSYNLDNPSHSFMLQMWDPLRTRATRVHDKALYKSTFTFTFTFTFRPVLFPSLPTNSLLFIVIVVLHKPTFLVHIGFRADAMTGLLRMTDLRLYRARVIMTNVIRYSINHFRLLNSAHHSIIYAFIRSNFKYGIRHKKRFKVNTAVNTSLINKCI